MTTGRRLRVALVHHLSEPRGVRIHCLRLAEGLQALGHHVRLFSLTTPGANHGPKPATPATAFPAPPRTGDDAERFTTAVEAFGAHLQAASLSSFDLVHVHDALDAAAVAAAGREAVSLLVRTVHHLDLELAVDDARIERAQEEGIRNADVLVAVSRFWAGYVREHFGRTPFVVRNGVDRTRVEPPAGFVRGAFRARRIPDGRFVFVAVGGVSPRKGTLELFEAAALLLERGHKPFLVVVGSDPFNAFGGYRERVVARAVELDLVEGRDYLLVGAIPDVELAAWLAAADAFVTAAVNEGWGLSLLEAMAAGLPVVATDIPVFREFLGPGDAVVVPPRDSTSLADGMARIVDDPSLRLRLAGRGPAIANGYTWEACAAAHDLIYRQALRGHEAG